MATVSHPEGMPDLCSDHCSANNIHPGDEVTGTCPSCGGSARGCADLPGGCRESRQAAMAARDWEDFYPGDRP
jgi:hypothetical protein